ncbi:MAG: hypothetical protein AAF633_09435, partial [Chloroflexota bacterium]
MKLSSYNIFLTVLGVIFTLILIGSVRAVRSIQENRAQVEFFPTPTLLATIQPNSRATVQIVSDEPVLRATAPSIDYDNLLEIEAVQARQTVVALEESVVTIKINANQRLREISPLIYGSNAAAEQDIVELNPLMYNWSSNHSARYNWRAGNAFNEGRQGNRLIFWYSP